MRRVAETRLPTDYGEFTVIAYDTTVDDRVHARPGDGRRHRRRAGAHARALRMPAPATCSARAAATAAPSSTRRSTIIARAGRGVLVYMRQEGRGIGLLNKLRAYELQDQGKDTVEANHALGFGADLRHYGIGAQILVDLGREEPPLPHQQPEEDRRASRATGSAWWSGCRSRAPPTEENRRYLITKREKLGHLFSSLPD